MNPSSESASPPVGPSSPEPPGQRARVLVVDDQRNMRISTAGLLRAAGHEVIEAASGEEALRAIKSPGVDVMLTDIRMAPIDGLTLLRRGLEISQQMQVIFMTGYGSIEGAVEAMRLGACDYVTKPFQDQELRYRVARAIERGRLLLTVDGFAKDFHTRHGLSALIGTSPPMRELISRILKVAPSDTTVLVTGESGTGKELVARALHAHSRRKDRAFVPVNCAAIPEGLLESELFGHARGAFTGAVRARQGLFEEANGGTLFIDEVTETTQAFQSKLLRVLQDGEMRRVGESSPLTVDVRIVAATNRDIEREVREKRFRQDLFYRLAVVTMKVPPLRDRAEDIPLLARHFLERANSRAPREKRFTQATEEALQAYSFPGNVRELENAVEQAVALSEGDELLPEDFPLVQGTVAHPHHSGDGELRSGPTLAEVVLEAERRAIALTLERYPRDLARVADALAVSPTTLWRKMKRLGLKGGGAGN